MAHIFFTHGHSDHIGTAGDYPNALMHSLTAEIPIIEGREAVERPLPSGDPEPTGITVDAAARGWSGHSPGDPAAAAVFALPGHTIGSAAYLIDDVLFLGDAAYVSSDGEITGPTWIFSTDVEQSNRSWRALVARLDDLDLEVYPCVLTLCVARRGLVPLRRYLDATPDDQSDAE